jgi:NAD(P)-dependent dehydrogenase (short-subunit alcohol dehydrogenase family)
VQVGSISDNRLGGWYSYRASKAALNQLTRTMALELARKKLPVAAVLLHPGTCDTGLSQPFQKVRRREGVAEWWPCSTWCLALLLARGDDGWCLQCPVYVECCSQWY